MHIKFEFKDGVYILDTDFEEHEAADFGMFLYEVLGGKFNQDIELVIKNKHPNEANVVFEAYNELVNLQKKVMAAAYEDNMQDKVVIPPSEFLRMNEVKK